MHPPSSKPMEVAAVAVACRPGLLARAQPGGMARTRAREHGVAVASAPSAARRRLLVASLGVGEPLPAQSLAEEAVALEVDEDDLNSIVSAENLPPAAADVPEARTVRVKFVLKQQCAFGQQFLVVGDDAALGRWDPAKATALNWSDGHVWTAETDLPANKLVEFKFLLRDASGHVCWQHGANRTLQITETPNTMVVHEDWNHAQKQTVSSEEALSVRAEDVMFSEDVAGTNGEMPAETTRTHPPLYFTSKSLVIKDSLLYSSVSRTHPTSISHLYIKGPTCQPPLFLPPPTVLLILSLSVSLSTAGGAPTGHDAAELAARRRSARRRARHGPLPKPRRRGPASPQAAAARACRRRWARARWASPCVAMGAAAPLLCAWARWTPRRPAPLLLPPPLRLQQQPWAGHGGGSGRSSGGGCARGGAAPPPAPSARGGGRRARPSSMALLRPRARLLRVLLPFPLPWPARADLPWRIWPRRTTRGSHGERHGGLLLPRARRPPCSSGVAASRSLLGAAAMARVVGPVLLSPRAASATLAGSGGAATTPRMAFAAASRQQCSSSDKLQTHENLETDRSAVVVADAPLQGEMVAANEANQPQLMLDKHQTTLELHGEQNGTPSPDDYAGSNDDDTTLCQEGDLPPNRPTSILENDLAWAGKAMQQLLRFLGFQIGTTRT